MFSCLVSSNSTSVKKKRGASVGGLLTLFLASWQSFMIPVGKIPQTLAKVLVESKIEWLQVCLQP